jgi:predicted NBD/HSP70 family sugar kinase
MIGTQIRTCVVDNDLKQSTLGEAWFGAGKRSQCAACCGTE